MAAQLTGVVPGYLPLSGDCPDRRGHAGLRGIYLGLFKLCQYPTTHLDRGRPGTLSTWLFSVTETCR
jgi:hypothetical protein